MSRFIHVGVVSVDTKTLSSGFQADSSTIECDAQGYKVPGKFSTGAGERGTCASPNPTEAAQLQLK